MRVCWRRSKKWGSTQRAQRDSEHLGTRCQTTAVQFVTETADPEGSPLNPDMLCVIRTQVCTFILSSVFHKVSPVAPSYCYPAGDFVLSFQLKRQFRESEIVLQPPSE